jgi:DMSO/TMAO reductase YedYZ heme-binding membrane subunit
VAATSGRSRRRHRARSGAPGPVAEHRSKIMTALAAGTIVVVAVLAMTSEGHDIAAATQRFMLYYAGVFALIGLTGSVVAGLIATDRVILTPGHRVLAQAVHRAVSFGALAFLIVHIVTEIMAQRVHVIDAFVPFMSPFRTFYIGLGTIASDLILAQVVTSIVRKRFTADGKAWRWRAIHYTAYLSFLFGVLHGLMAGRSAKPYVDWSYGFAIALVVFGLAVRFLATSLRSKEKLSATPAVSSASASSVAALNLMQTQVAGTIQMLPAQSFPGRSMPVQGLPSVAVYPQPAMAGLPAPQPHYEPGYIGPPRYDGAPRGGTGPLPQVLGAPVQPYDSGPLPRVDTGSFPRSATGSFPRADSGPMPRISSDSAPRISSDSAPRMSTDPMPRIDTGPRYRFDTGSMPRVGTGPMPRVGTGPMPRVGTGPMPRVDTGPIPRVDTGPLPRIDTGPMPRVGTGPARRVSPGPLSRAGAEPGRRPAGQRTWTGAGALPPEASRDERTWHSEQQRHSEQWDNEQWDNDRQWRDEQQSRDQQQRRGDQRSRDEQWRDQVPRGERPRFDEWSERNEWARPHDRRQPAGWAQQDDRRQPDPWAQRDEWAQQDDRRQPDAWAQRDEWRGRDEWAPRDEQLRREGNGWQ